MPQIQVEDLPKNQQKLTVTVAKDEMQPYIDDAVKRISENTKIPGFREGKATYDAVKVAVGEMKIYEEALDPIVRKTFIEAILSKNIETVGSPKVDIVKLAPGNDLVFTAEVSLMPKVTKLADFENLSVEAKTVKATDKDIEIALKDIQRMQTKETRAKADHPVAKEDKVVVDMQMKKDKVPVEGGQGIGHVVYLSESYYIPGLVDELVGMKEGEEKKFQLEFPKEHFQKHLAGQKIDFEIKLKEVYELDHPKLDDAFAVSIGQKDMASLKTILKENIQNEKDQEEKYRQEKEMLELLSKESEYQEFPDLLLNEEIQKMIHELEHNLSEQGLEMDGYLKKIKKTLGELKVDLTPQALIRIKVALVIREVAKQKEVKVESKALDEELDRLAEGQEKKELKDRIYSPEYRDYTESIMRHRKVIDLLRNAMIKTIDKT